MIVHGGKHEHHESVETLSHIMGCCPDGLPDRYVSIALFCGVTAVFSSEWFRTIHGGLFWTGVFLALILFVAWVDLTK